MKFFGDGIGATVIDFTGVTPDANTDGSLYCFYGYVGYQDDVTVRDLTVKSCVDPGGVRVASNMKTGARWLVTGVETAAGGAGFNGGSGSVFDLSRSHDNQTFGFTGAGTVQNSEVDHNGGVPDGGGSMGGSKSVRQGDVYWLSNRVHDNLGPGIWADGHSGDFVVRGNDIRNNTGAGIDFEISWHPTNASNLLAENNTLVGNDTDLIGKSCFWSAQVLVQNSEGVVVRNNIIDSSNGSNAICAVDTDRAESYPDYPENVEPFLAEGNTITLGTQTIVGQRGDQNGEHVHTVDSVPFRSNLYLGDTGGAHWQWINSSSTLTLPQWQSLGQQ
jgi:hypothetical protein